MKRNVNWFIAIVMAITLAVAQAGTGRVVMAQEEIISAETESVVESESAVTPESAPEAKTETETVIDVDNISGNFTDLIHSNVEFPVASVAVPDGGIAGKGTSGIETNAIYGLPADRQAEIQIKNVMDLNANVRSGRLKAAPPTVGSTKKFFTFPTQDGLHRDSSTFKLAAIGDKCLVYIDTNVFSNTVRNTFMPNGEASTADALKVAAQYDNEIYSLILNPDNSTYFGEAGDLDGNDRLTILMYEIPTDSPNYYIAGYFFPLDFYVPGGDAYDSNVADIIYLDVTDRDVNAGYYGGFNNYAVNGVESFCGVVAHELQHSVNFTEFIKQQQKYGDQNAEEDSIWLNEGLSGTADWFYQGQFNLGHVIMFLANEYGSGTGRVNYMGENVAVGLSGSTYIPDDDKWTERAYSPTSNIMMNYGAASFMLAQYWAYGNGQPIVMNELEIDPRGGDESALSLGYQFWENQNSEFQNSYQPFNSFFERFILELAVDSVVVNGGRSYDYRYKPLSNTGGNVGNMWSLRGSLDTYEPQIVGMGDQTVSLDGGDSYRPDLKVLQLDGGNGNNTINFNITDNTDYRVAGYDTQYYAVLAQSPIGTTTSDAWENAPKTFVQLEANHNYQLRYGADSYFAILMIGFENEGVGTIYFGTASNQNSAEMVSFILPKVVADQSYWKGWISSDIPVTLTITADHISSTNPNATISDFSYRVTTDKTPVADLSKSGWIDMRTTTEAALTVSSEGEQYIQWFAENAANEKASGIFGPYAIDKTAPTASVSAVANSQSSIAVTGTAADGVSGISNIEWYRSTASGGQMLLPVTALSFTDTELQADTAYTYKLVVYDKANNGKEATATATTQSAAIDQSGGNDGDGNGGGSSSSSSTTTMGATYNVTIKTVNGNLAVKVDTKLSKVVIEDTTAAAGTKNHEFTLSGKDLSNFAKSNPDLILEFTTAFGLYQVPVDMEALIKDYEKILRQAGVKAEEVMLKFSLTDMTGDKELTGALTDQFAGGKVLGSIVDFKITITDKSGNVIGEVSDLNKPVNKVIIMPDTMKSIGNTWGSFVYSPAAKAYAPVPGISETVNGKMIVNIPTNTNSIYAVVLNNVKFTDTLSHWGKAYINVSASKGLVAGMGDGTFKPDKEVTRVEFVTMISNALYLPKTAKTAGYLDVSTSAWYYDSVAKAKSVGLLNNFTLASFEPNKPITREEMADIVGRALVYEDGSIKADTDALSGFTDTGKIGTQYAKHASIAVKYNVMVGMEDDSFAPDGITTRAQAAVVLIKMLQTAGLADKF